MKNMALHFWHTTLLSLVLACTFSNAAAQSSSLGTTPGNSGTTATTVSAVPPLVRFSGVAKDADGVALSRTVGVTFMIYKDQEGGTPLWLETQNVQPDSTGQYSVMLGATKSDGLPSSLFATGDARWLEVQISGQPEQPRVLLLSVPYAMKAADADTVGGFPASAFLLAPQNTASGETAASTSAAPQAAVTGVTADAAPTGSGTAGFLPLWTTASNLGISGIFQSSGGLIGINTSTPAVTLDVAGNMYIRGGFTMPPQGTATATTSFNSHSYFFSASAYNSSSKTAANQTFAWEASALGNNTATPSATLKLRFAEGTGTSNPTGFQIASNGILSFAGGQTFPGTVTDVTAGTGLTGGGTSSNVTVNVDSTKVPLLANANTFNATQTITNGDLNLPATTSAKVGVLNIGGVPFLHGYTAANQDVFVGDAGNFVTTGIYNTGVGVGALAANTSGYENTALGNIALTSNTTGGNNLAVGYETLPNNSTGGGNTAGGNQALLYSVSGTLNTGFGYGAVRSNTTGNFNTGVGGNAGNIPDTSSGTGSYNTALGAYASASTGTLTNTTAVGANAIVGQNNTLVLGNTTSTPGAEFVNVGIGTETPRSTIEATVSAPGALGPALTLTNSGSGSNTAASLDFNSYLPSSTGTYNPAARIAAVDDGNSDFGTNLVFYLNGYGQKNNGLQQTMLIAPYGVNVSGTLSGQGAGNAAPGVTGEGGLAASGGVGGAGGVFRGGEATTATGGDGGEFYGGSSSSGQGGAGGYFMGGGSSGGIAGPGDGADVYAGASTNPDDTIEGYGIFVQAANMTLDSSYAGVFAGNVVVQGTLSAASKDFKIDHPLDPANKYLVHASVESSEMMNIYTGNVVTDESGLATVTLPSWFESLNTDFRYQLTTIGQDAHAWISQKVNGGKFSLSTNASNIEVSWQITAVRQDAYAKAHPLIAEQEKPANERGYYIHPELYGQPEQRQTEWGRRPERMRQMEAQRERARLTSNSRAASGTAKAAAAQPASAANRTFAHPAVAPLLKPTTAVKPTPLATPAAAKP
jgi:trimeric autotransporter adhesin